MAKNKVINKNLESKSIPNLELQALDYAVEMSMDVFKELSGDFCLCPININKIFVVSDSSVALNCVNLYFNKK